VALSVILVRRIEDGSVKLYSLPDSIGYGAIQQMMFVQYLQAGASVKNLTNQLAGRNETGR
jgi:hypothetical protein